ncbi:hypothetical protein ScPMuIL_009927 [Solemya velum]
MDLPVFYVNPSPADSGVDVVMELDSPVTDPAVSWFGVMATYCAPVKISTIVYRAKWEKTAKCLELLTSLRLGEEIRHQDKISRRPKTALPAYGRNGLIPDLTNPYGTSYQRDFPQKQLSETKAVRPMTSQGFVPDISDQGTTYGTEFNTKQMAPAVPIRSGTASGDRNNKPHPLQSFLIWRFPSKAREEHTKCPWSEELTDEKMAQVSKRLCQSTYQCDYLGIPQGCQVKSAFGETNDWKERVPYTLDSVQRYSYQAPVPPKPLRNATTRYACNKKKNIPADGTIPTASARYMHIKPRTTYDRHYNDKAGAIVQQIRDVGNKLGAEALKKCFQNATGPEKEMIGRIIGNYDNNESNNSYVPCPPQRPPSRISYKSRTPLATPVSNFNVPVQSPAPHSSRVSDAAYTPPLYIR